MLLDILVDYCNQTYLRQKKAGQCTFCNHPTCHCPGIDCETCLDQVHFPNKYTNGRMDYLCPNIPNYYVCKYTHKYSSEIEYALNTIDHLPKLDKFNILSLGCGASPDLIAIENYVKRNGFNISIDYLGIDINDNWKPIHDVIKSYGFTNKINIGYLYEDVIETYKDHYSDKINIFVMQYLISHFYNTGKLTMVRDFYKRLIKNVVSYMPKEAVIIINDVNSCYRGRDLLVIFANMIQQAGINARITQRYFNYNIRNVHQEYGIVYPNNNVLEWPSSALANYNPWTVCSSAQLIIELG